jgi:hypothetical protein
LEYDLKINKIKCAKMSYLDWRRSAEKVETGQN